MAGATRATGHRAFVYASPAEYVDVVGSFLDDGARAGDGALVIVDADRAAWLRAALGPGLAGAALLDAATTYDPPGAAAAALVRHLRAVPDGQQRQRLVAEAPVARWPAALRADHVRREATLNALLGELPTTLLCPYDARLLDGAALDRLAHTHPTVHAAGTASVSSTFVDPRALVTSSSAVVTPPAGAAEITCDAPEELATARAFVRSCCRAAGRSATVTEELTVAAGEVLTNALLHGGPPRRLLAYDEDRALVLHVHDHGPGLTDPLAGFLPPTDAATHGRGLWAARQLADVVEVATDDSGTHVRILSLPDAA